MDTSAPLIGMNKTTDTSSDSGDGSNTPGSGAVPYGYSAGRRGVVRIPENKWTPENEKKRGSTD